MPDMIAIDADPELFHGLTIWTDSVSMQMRSDDVALHVRSEAPRSPETGNPVLLSHDEARKMRDLLNVATARGAL